MQVSFLFRSFLTIIEFIIGKIQITCTSHQRMFLFIKKNKCSRTCWKYVHNMYKWLSKYCKWLTLKRIAYWLRGHLCYAANFWPSLGWQLKTGLTVHVFAWIDPVAEIDCCMYIYLYGLVLLLKLNNACSDDVHVFVWFSTLIL